MKLFLLLPICLFSLCTSCRSTTGHKRLGFAVPVYTDYRSRGRGPTDEVDVEGAAFSLQLETADQLWLSLELAGRTFEYQNSDSFPRSGEVAVSLIRELGGLNERLQPFVEASGRARSISAGLGTHYAVGAGAGLRWEMMPNTILELGAVHEFSMSQADDDLEFDGVILRLGVLLDF